MNTKSQAGKGSAPRNCFSEKFKTHFDEIVWNKSKPRKSIKVKTKTRYVY